MLHSAAAHAATVTHCPAIDQTDNRRRSGRTAMKTGAASGNSPTGPFDRLAPTTHNPETHPAPNAVPALPQVPTAMAAVAAIAKTHTVVSSRFPTIDHDTTGAAIHNAIGNHSRSLR